MPFEVSGLTVNVNAHCHLREFKSTANAPELPTAPPAPGTVASNRIIQEDQPFQILFHWNQRGVGTWALAAGDWNCEIFLEQMGPGEATNAAGYFSTTVSGNAAAGFYAAKIDVPRNTVAPGVYRVVCSMQLVVAGQPRALAGFDDLGLIRVIAES